MCPHRGIALPNFRVAKKFGCQTFGWWVELPSVSWSVSLDIGRVSVFDPQISS
jgi:hypothetical protein